MYETQMLKYFEVSCTMGHRVAWYLELRPLPRLPFPRDSPERLRSSLFRNSFPLTTHPRQVNSSTAAAGSIDRSGSPD